MVRAFFVQRLLNESISEVSRLMEDLPMVLWTALVSSGSQGCSSVIGMVCGTKSLPLMRELGYPVVMDATHAVQRPGGLGTGSGGDGRFAPVLARAAVAAGVDGVFMETHVNPKVAKSDAANAIRQADVEKLWRTLLKLHEVVR